VFADAPQLKKKPSREGTVVSTIESVVEDLRAGKMIVLMDDEDRENEGDLVAPAQGVTADQVNFMALHARGLVCMPITAKRVESLGLRMMVAENTAPLGTAFTVSIDSRSCRGGGVSVADRAVTIRDAVREDAKPDDFIVPGHVFPLRARDGGVLVRTGQTEGSVDLCRLAGLQPAAVICEILNEDGTMSRLPELVDFAAHHDLKIATVADLIEYRLQNETLVTKVATARLPTLVAGEFTAHVFRTEVEEGEHFVLVKGDIAPDTPTLVRAHAEYLPGDVFASLHRNTSAVLEASMRTIEAAGSGVVLYVRRPGRGAEMLAGDVGASASTNPSARLANFKNYGIGAQILRALGVRQIRLLTNGRPRLPNLAAYGLEVVETVPVDVG